MLIDIIIMINMINIVNRKVDPVKSIPQKMGTVYSSFVEHDAAKCSFIRLLI